MASPQFDQFATSYDQALDRGLAATGEDKNYFAQGRIRWLASNLARLSPPPRIDSVFDYGCGTGSAVPFLRELAPKATILGVDPSTRSLAVARQTFGAHDVRFATLDEHRPKGDQCLAYCNGIFHHIAPADRPGALEYIRDSLRLGGFFSFWENNPWNPGTRWVMSRIPFDRDAIPLSVLEARRLLRDAGFEILRTDFLFIFPRWLRPLRVLEAPMSAVPAGAQYQVLCRKI